MDGIHFGEKQILLRNENYPDTYSCHIRDPKVFREEDRYYMVLGARTRDSRGASLLYSSKDKFHWEYEREFLLEEDFGYMWECPDIFCVEDRWFLSCSPQGLTHEKYRFQNVYQSGYFMLEENFLEKGLEEGANFHEWDMGFDFYAPQTFEDEKGRRILIGWMGIPDADYTNIPTLQYGWQHILTMPRVVTSKNGKLLQNPPEEFKKLRRKGKTLSGEFLKTEELYELEMNGLENQNLSMTICEDLHLCYEKESGIFTMNFTGKAGYGRRKRQCRLEPLTSLRIFVDRSAIEIYINEGETVFSTRFYPTDYTLQFEMKKGNAKYFPLKQMEVSC